MAKVGRDVGNLFEPGLLFSSREGRRISDVFQDRLEPAKVVEGLPRGERFHVQGLGRGSATSCRVTAGKAIGEPEEGRLNL